MARSERSARFGTAKTSWLQRHTVAVEAEHQLLEHDRLRAQVQATRGLL
ncbi:hypothetical protein [Agrococcus lahaulensis]|nr:hypothetical protein [Agrococcus lahaulensis]